VPKFEAGQLAICRIDEPWTSKGKIYKGPAPANGCIYRIAEVSIDPHIIIDGVRGALYLRFEGIPMYWHERYFTPVRTPVLDVLRRILFGKGIRRPA